MIVGFHLLLHYFREEMLFIVLPRDYNKPRRLQMMRYVWELNRDEGYVMNTLRKVLYNLGTTNNWHSNKISDSYLVMKWRLIICVHFL